MKRNVSYGDLNGDKLVSMEDLTLFSAAIESGDLNADFNDDGIVDGIDLQTLYINLNKSFNDGVFMQGSDADDKIVGGKGNDILLGHGGDDKISGGKGDDVLFGGDGDDFIKGEKGDDYIDAGAGTNKVIGNGGADTFSLSFADPDFSPNTYRFDQIEDFDLSKDILKIDDAAVEVAQYLVNLDELTFLFVSTQNYTIDELLGGADIDYLTAYASLNGLEIFLDAYANVVNKMHGGDNNDDIMGGNLGDFLNGNGGDDAINGRQGDDVLSGGAGNDTLRGAKGDDTLDGGDGDDFLFAGGGSNEVSSGAGNDIIIVWNGDNTLIFTNDDFTDNASGDVVRGYGSGDIIDLTDLGDLYFAASDGADGITLNIVVNTHNAPVSPNWIHHSVLFEGTHDLDLVESSIIY